jgi:hypothetical protein
MLEATRLAAVVLFGALIADGGLTILVLRNGGRELNPFMSLMIGKIGLNEAIVASRGFAIALVAVFSVLNAFSFLIGLLVPTVFFVCCGAYNAIRTRV